MSDVALTVTQVNTPITVTVTPPVGDPVALTVTQTVEQVSLTVGPQIGIPGPAGTPFTPATSWIGLATGAVTIGAETAVVTPSAGVRLPYTYAGPITRYRFMANDGTADAFYSDLSLTTLIVSRYL